MFIFDLVYGLVQVATLGGSAIFVWQDYKRGFATSKSLFEGATRKIRRLTGLRESEVEKAQNTVNAWAKNIASLRESLASIEAGSKQALRQSQEQKLLASQFEDVEVEALRKNDEEAATAAAVAKIQADTRFNLFEEHAQAQNEVARVLERELDSAEMEFGMAQTKAETIGLNESISEAQCNLYELVSNIGINGLTPKGELEQAVLRTEHKRLKAGVLLRLAGKTNNNKVRRFMQIAEVSKELDQARKRIALLPASTEASAVEESRSVSEVSEAELVN